MAWLNNDNIITSLGTRTHEVLKNIEKGETGIRHGHKFDKYTKAPLSLVDFTSISEELSGLFPDKNLSRFESLAALSMQRTLKGSNINPGSPRTLFILSSTKGNIDLLKAGAPFNPEILLHQTAVKISGLFGFVNRPQVVCNACISGVLALILAQRYIDNDLYDQVVVTGVDIVSEFVVAGFESFKSMSETPCRPFDIDREGLSLGEGAGTLIVTNKAGKNSIKIAGGASANDANHISGPSRTGEGLYLAAGKALNGKRDIDFISAHGTATLYNDDMESQAVSRLELNHVPVNSFKGYFGHTLGAAGIIETILTKHSMLQNKIYKSLGCFKTGVARSLNIIQENTNKELNRCLKLSSGFGGCNAALLLEKNGK